MWLNFGSTKTYKSSDQKIISKLIDQIHNDFYNEVDVLIGESSKLKEYENYNEELIKKSKILSNLGFKQSIEVSLGKVEADKIKIIQTENENKIAELKTTF